MACGATIGTVDRTGTVARSIIGLIAANLLFPLLGFGFLRLARYTLMIDPRIVLAILQSLRAIRVPTFLGLSTPEPFLPNRQT